MKYITLILILCMVWSCNVFSVFEEDSPTQSIADKYRSGKFIEALNEVNKALINDPFNSDLLYYRVKIRLKVFYKFNDKHEPLDAISLIEQMQEISDSNKAIIPYYNTVHDPFERHGVRNIFVLNKTQQDEIDKSLKNNELENFPRIIEDLALIYENKTTGSISKEYIESDYGMLLIIYGLVKLRDTDVDNEINSGDYKFPIKYQDASAVFTKLPEQFLSDKYLAGIGSDSLLTIYNYMIANGIKLVDTDKSSFKPESVESHRVFFDKHIYKYLISDIQSFAVNIENVRTSFLNVVNDNQNNPGILYKGLNIIENLIKSDKDEDVQKLTRFLDDLKNKLQSFTKASMEKELWYNNIQKELTSLILGKN